MLSAPVRAVGLVVKASVKVTWDKKALEAAKQEALDALAKQIAFVPCPVHGAGATLNEPCCGEWTAAVARYALTRATGDEGLANLPKLLPT